MYFMQLGECVNSLELKSISMEFTSILILCLEIISRYVVENCILLRGKECTCNAEKYKVDCSRIPASVDGALPGNIPLYTRELIMKRIWVDDAVELNPRNFMGLTNLRKIDFSYNRITEIHSETFRNMNYLQTVNMSHNRLKLLDRDAFKGNFPHLKNLDLSHNRILVLIDHNLSAMYNLRRLDLRKNPILYISEGAFSNLDHLESLRISLANFTKFPVDALRVLRNLSYLEMSHLPHLSSLPPGAFSNNHRLDSLVLEDIPLSEGGLDGEAFAGLTRLVNLSMISCNLTSVPREAIGDIRNLSYLDLSRNPLHTIHPGDFVKLVNLQKLILQNTFLREIKVEAFKTLDQLQTLDISANRLKTLYRGSFPDNFSSLSSILMNNNQWSCDCRVAWIKKSLQIKIGRKPVTCAHPGPLMSVNLLTFELQERSNENCLSLVDIKPSKQLVQVEGNEAVLPCRRSSIKDVGFTTYTWYRDDENETCQTLSGDCEASMNDLTAKYAIAKPML